jgi:broad specificity phosphatase PhoE
MRPQTIFLIRHGEVDSNTLVLDRMITTADFNKIVDAVSHEGLNTRGIAQARAAAVRLEGRGLSCLYCSPLLRARQTAEILANHLGLPIIVRDDLYELLPAPLPHPFDQIFTLKRAYIQSGLRLGNPFTRDTETAHHAIRRVTGAWRALTAENRTNFAVVGHQGIFELLFLWIRPSLVWELAYGDTSNCGISVITRRCG